MNREIKFRAWDSIKKKIIYLAWSFTGAGALEVSVDVSRGQYEIFPLMQFTGLTDKNCKEIYEGDIVKLTNEDEETRTSKIYYENGAFCIENLQDFLGDGDFDYMTLNYLEDWLVHCGVIIEIIGNIFENPELLEHHDENH